MFSKLFRRRPKSPANPSVKSGVRLYAIGDIHGRADLLSRMHELILTDIAAGDVSRPVVVYLGDYIDRGHESCAVIDMLLDTPLQDLERVHLLGNHEQSMLIFLNDVGIGPSWLSFGGRETLLSYGVIAKPELTRSEDGHLKLQAELREKLPESHLKFLEAMPLSHAEGDYFFVHAGIRPRVALDRQREEDLLWIRDEFLSAVDDHGKIVVHGHSVRREPEFRANRIGIDTGAYATGRLTCLVLEGSSRRLLQT